MEFTKVDFCYVNSYYLIVIIHSVIIDTTISRTTNQESLNFLPCRLSLDINLVLNQ
jgi:hypothetical protein